MTPTELARARAWIARWRRCEAQPPEVVDFIEETVPALLDSLAQARAALAAIVRHEQLANWNRCIDCDTSAECDGDGTDATRACKLATDSPIVRIAAASLASRAGDGEQG